MMKPGTGRDDSDGVQVIGIEQIAVKGGLIINLQIRRDDGARPGIFGQEFFRQLRGSGLSRGLAIRARLPGQRLGWFQADGEKCQDS